MQLWPCKIETFELICNIINGFSFIFNTTFLISITFAFANFAFLELFQEPGGCSIHSSQSSDQMPEMTCDQ